MSIEPVPGGEGKSDGKLRLRKPWERVKPKNSEVPAKYGLLHQQLLEAHQDAALKAYVTGRWLDAVAGARASMKRDQREFRRMNLATLGAAAVSPALVAATAATEGPLHTVLTVAAIITSLTAAIGGVLLQTTRPGIKWRLHRTLRDQLEALAWAHLAAVAANPLSTPAGQLSWSGFVAGVEKSIGDHNAGYAEEVAGVLETRRTKTSSPTADA